MQVDLSAHRGAFGRAVATLEAIDPNTGLKKYVVNRDPGKDPSEAKAKKILCTQSYLRSEIAIDQNLTSYNLPILTSDTPVTLIPTENRLKQQDVFFCYSMFYGVLVAATGGGNTSFRNEIMTFPNPNLYLSAGLNIDLMTGLWTNGKMSVTMNQQVVTPAWDLAQHLCIDQTQIITGNWPLTSPYFNQLDLSIDGRVTVEPNWIINGGNNNIFNITYPESLTTIGIGSSAQFRHVMILRGFLAQNCSSIMDPH